MQFCFIIPSKTAKCKQCKQDLGCGYLIPKKAGENCNNKKSSAQKKDGAPQKDTLMRTTFIRVSKENMTGEDKSILVTYTKEQIKDILDLWAFESGLTYWFIEHNPDEEDNNAHFHIVIRFKTNSRFSTIKSKFPYGDIEPIKSTVKKTVQYLVHLNDLSKTQYSWDSVITNCGDLASYKVQDRSQEAVALQSYFDRIESEDITWLNVRAEVPVQLYAKYKNQLNNALECVEGRRFKGPDRNIEVVFIEGPSGVGKTDYAKYYCEKHGLSCCIGGANDPWQKYRGEDAFVYDDLRDSFYPLHKLLKITDHHTDSLMPCRYEDKQFRGSIIFITSTIPIDHWYYNVVSEQKHQLRRRAAILLKLKDNLIYSFKYNEVSMVYEPTGVAKNPLRHKVSTMATSLDMFDGMDLELCSPGDYPSIDACAPVGGIPEATEEEKESRRIYEASLPPINQENINKYRIG